MGGPISGGGGGGMSNPMTTAGDIITGGASGIGLSTVQMLARDGCRVAINHLADDPRGMQEVERLRAAGFDVLSAPGNVGDAADCQRMVEQAIADLGRLDFLVANAGTPGTRHSIPASNLDGITEELWNAVVQVNLIVGRQVASMTDGAMAWLYNADRLYQLPLGVVGIAIGIVLLPELSRRLRAGDETGSRSAYNRGAEFALLLTVPAAVALVVIAWPIITVVYQRGAFGPEAAIHTAHALAAYGVGLPAFVLQKVLQPLYYAREDTRSPFRFAVWSMLVNAVLAVGLLPVIGFLAAAIATSVSAWVMVWQLWHGTGAMGEAARLDARFLHRLPRIVAASALMGLVLWGLSAALAGQLATPGLRTAALGGIILAGIALYFAAATVLGAMSLPELKSSLRRRKG